MATAYQQETADSIYDYFNEILDVREAERKDDILSRFLDAEVEGEKLTREDILDICFLFLIAGLDTVTATLDCMFAYLAAHPDQRQPDRRRPVHHSGRRRGAPPVGDAGPWASPGWRWRTPRWPAAPSHKGDNVMVMLGSVNTDEADLPDADEVRFDREVNRHVAFGGGVHRCLGSHLARQELRVALREWHRRIPDYGCPRARPAVYTAGHPVHRPLPDGLLAAAAA